MISTRRRPPCAVKFRDVPLSALVLCRGARWRGLSRGHAALGRRDLAVAAGGPAPTAQVTAHRGQRGELVTIETSLYGRYGHAVSVVRAEDVRNYCW